MRDQIDAIGDTIEDNELVLISHNGFSPLWHKFVEIIYGWEKLPDFKQLWDAFIGEEVRLQQVSMSYKDEDDELDLSLIRNIGRGGRKGGPGRV